VIALETDWAEVFHRDMTILLTLPMRGQFAIERLRVN
jgi:hypothetical protein